MPEISRFYGIIITMFADDHNPPHFHIRYGDKNAIVFITDGTIKGNMSRQALYYVYRWLDIHKDELLDNWNKLQNGEQPNPINPLK